MIVGVVLFVGAKIGPALDDETFGIHEPAAFARFLWRQSGFDEHVDNVLGDADAGLARAEE